MKKFSAHVEDLHARYVENLKRGLDIERKLSRTHRANDDQSIDKKLVAEFRRYLKQSEGHLARIEGLLRH